MDWSWLAILFAVFAFFVIARASALAFPPSGTKLEESGEHPPLA